MNFRRPLLAVLALASAACSESSTALDDVRSVRVTPASLSIDVGLTVQFTAEALDAEGNVVPGITFEWSSSNTTVATVTSDGLAEALSVGTAAITASAGAGTPGSQVLIVETSQCTDRIDVILNPGEHQAYDGDTCLLLPSGSVGNRYRIAVTRPTLIEDPDDVPNVWLEINPVLTAEQVAGAEPVAPAIVPATYSTSPALADTSARLDGSRFLEDARIMERTRRFHLELRQRELDVGLRTAPLLPSRPALTAAGAPSRVDPPASDSLFLVVDIDCPATATRTPVKLVGFNDHIAIYQDSTSNESDPLRQNAVDLMLSYFASYVNDLVNDYWGTTPDTDGNGRVLIATSDALPDSAAAVVFSGDFRSTADCASSNEGEVMYFARDVIDRLAHPVADSVSYLGLSVMAHEMKHVTSLYHSVARGQFHRIWIEEGTAEISQTMSSRAAWAAVGGPAVGDVIDGNEIIQWNNDNGEIGPEAWGVVSEIIGLIIYGSTQPNSMITNPKGAAEFHTFYSGGWHLHRFIGDAFGNASTPFGDAPLFREMTDSLTPAGEAALLTVTGRMFEQLFEDLVVAMSFHDAGPTPARAFTTWDLNTAGAIFSGPPELAPPHRYPWPVTADASSGNPSASFARGVYSCPPQIENGDYVSPAETDRCPMGPSGIRFHDFVSTGEGAGSQVQVFGAASGKLVVTRIQ